MRGVLLLIALFLFAHSARAQLALDGSVWANYSSGSSITSGALSTSNANDVVLVVVSGLNNSGAAPTVTGVSGCGLSWAKRFSTGSTSLPGVDKGDLDIWWAASSGALSSCAPTATYSTTPIAGDITVWGVSGANTTSPFDVNASIPKKASSTSPSATPTVTGVSTTAANTFLYAVAFPTGANNPGSGYSTVVVTSGSPDSADGQYKTVSVAQSGVTVAFGSGDAGGGYVMVADAIQKGSAGVTPHFFGFVPATVP
jgi:hypothetical protein